MAHLGSVTDFDPEVGWGTVLLADGRRLPFHLTRIADGSRTIAAGTAVTADVVPGGMGRWEASGLVALRAEAFPCPVCSSLVDGRPGTYEICPACGWEDDPVQRDDDAYAGGANPSALGDARAAWRGRS